MTGTVLLKDICNVHPAGSSRNRWKPVYRILCGIVSEYVISEIPVSSNKDLYNMIYGHFEVCNISAKEMYESFRQFGDLENILKKLDFTETDRSFDALINKVSFNGDSVTVGDVTFRLSSRILKIKELEGDHYALMYTSTANGPRLIPISGTLESAGLAEDTETLVFEEPECETESVVPTIDESDFFTLTEQLRGTDPDQREAISRGTDRNLVIVAGAGSGKTRSLVGRLCFLHIVKGIPLDRMALVTFTNAATGTLSRSAAEQISEINDRLFPGKPVPKVTAYTLSAFFKHIIEEFWSEIGFNTRPVFDLDGTYKSRRLRILGQVAQDIGIASVNSASEDMMKRIEMRAYGMITDAPQLDILLEAYTDWQIENSEVLDFHSIEYIVWRSLREPDSALSDVVSSKYDCFLVDEYQDVNRTQHEIFTSISSKGAHLTFVGDDDQTIYTFRGSDGAIIRNVMSDTAFDCVYLSTNYRCNGHIVNAGNGILKNLKTRAKSNRRIKAYRKDGPLVRIATHDDGFHNLAREVRKLHDSGNGKICILARDRYQYEGLLDALQAESVPCRVSTGELTPLSKDYEILKCILQMLNGVSVKEAMENLNDLLGTQFTAAELRQYLSGNTDFNGSNHDDLPKLSELIRISEILTVAHDNCDHLSDVISTYLNELSDTSNKSCVEELMNFSESRDVGYPPEQRTLTSMFRTFENTYRSKNRNDSSNNQNYVLISTIHKAKGLEYDSVFILGMDQKCPAIWRIDKEYEASVKRFNQSATARDDLMRLRNESESFDREAMISCSGSISTEHPRFTEIVDLCNAVFDWNSEFEGLSPEDISSLLEICKKKLDPIFKSYDDEIKAKGQEITTIEERMDSIEESLISIDPESDLAKLRNAEKMELRETRRALIRCQAEANSAKKALKASLKPIFDFRNICVSAHKCQNITKAAERQKEILNELYRQKSEKIAEETRLIYVAVSRASDRLYLCRSEDSDYWSKFIDMIPPIDRENYILGADDGCEDASVLKSILDTMLKSPSPNTSAIDHLTDDTLSSMDLIGGKSLKRMISTFRANNPLYNNLCGKSYDYLIKALKLSRISDVSGLDLSEEILYNIRCCICCELDSLFPPSEVEYDEDDVPCIADDLANNPSLGYTRYRAPSEEFVRSSLEGSETGLKAAAVRAYVQTSVVYGGELSSSDAMELVAAVIEISNLVSEKGNEDVFSTSAVTCAFECLKTAVEILFS